MYRLLLVDDEPNILASLRRLLASRNEFDTHPGGYQVQVFDSPIEALHCAETNPFDLVMSDYRMPGMDGVEFLKRFRQIQPDAMRIILSGYADLQALISAINEAQIFRFISKPWQDMEVKACIAQALAYRDLLIDNQRLADTLRIERGKLSRRDAELRRLEQESPGITKVQWAADGSVMLDDIGIEEIELKPLPQAGEH